jgi:hypothetical protein
LRFVQFLGILLTALAVVPGGAHLAALPNKMKMAQESYFIAQQIYAGWALFGIVLFGALGANLALTIMLRRRGRPFGHALAACLFIAANLAIFFIWTFPANQVTRNWTIVPENWGDLRAQWEYSHAVNAVVMLIALACVVAAALRQPLKREIT